MPTISRRGLIGKAAIIGGGMLLATSEEALAATIAAPAANGKAGKEYLPTFEHSALPLPFNAAKLDGISEDLITSHHEKDYAGAVKRLNEINQSISKLPPHTPPFLMGSLKNEELVAENSMILHELYFANLGGDGKVHGDIEKLIKSSFGSVEAWQHNFKLIAQSLSNGSGWVMLTYNPRDKRLRNVCSSDHTVGLANGTPLLVMDMYEHAYHADFGSDAKAYIEAFFKNINWKEVNRRAETV